jgi:hypothetical protein
MLVRGVVDDQVDDEADAALGGGAGELHQLAQGAVARVDAIVVGDVVAVVALGRGVERHQPEAGDPEAGQVVEAAGQAAHIAGAVAVGVHEGADVELVDDRVLVPQVVDDVRAVGRGRAGHLHQGRARKVRDHG